MDVGNVGSIIITLSAEGGKDVEKQLDAVTGKLKKSGQGMKEMGLSSYVTYANITKAMGALGIAAMMWQSPLIGVYLSEFMEILGSIGDTIGTVFAPFIEVALDELWKLSDWFASQAPFLAAALTPLLPIWSEFMNLVGVVGRAVLLFVVDILGKLISFISELFIAIYNKDWNKAWSVFSGAILSVYNWIKTNLVMPFLDWISNKISGHNWSGPWQFFADALNKLWTEYIKPMLPTWLTDFLTWMYNFFSSPDAITKIQMIGELIVAGMDWFKLGGIAANKFMQSFFREVNMQMASLTGSSTNTNVKGIGGRQVGGHVLGGASYITSERGPELFTPSSSGNITPNSELSRIGGTPITLINKVELDGRQIWQSVRQYSSAELRRLGGY